MLGQSRFPNLHLVITKIRDNETYKITAGSLAAAVDIDRLQGFVYNDFGALGWTAT